MEDRIYIIIAKVLQGEADSTEQQELDSWLSQDAKNATILEDARKAWAEADAILQAPKFDTAKAWEKVAQQTVLADIQPQEVPRRKTIVFSNWTRYVAAAAAVLLIAVLIWRPFSEKEVALAAVTENKRVVLADGSVISLRKGSTFSYPEHFGRGERRVRLEGEAYFEVARDEAHPFVIDAQSVDVKVLGTTFNVRCADKSADVAVTSGKVQVSADGAEAGAVVLLPGRKAHYENGQLSEQAATGKESAWNGGTLSFKNEPLAEVLRAIGSARDTLIQLGSGVDSARMVSADFKAQSLEDMLTELCLITNTRWEKSGAQYTVYPK